MGIGNTGPVVEFNIQVGIQKHVYILHVHYSVIIYMSYMYICCLFVLALHVGMHWLPEY